MAGKSLSDLLNNSTDRKDKILENAEIKIIGNILGASNSFIQISNVTQVWKGDIPKAKLPIIPLSIGGLIGLSFLSSGMSSRNGTISVILGLVILGIVGYIVYRNLNSTKYFGLNIELTSGRTYSFISNDPNFISKAFEVMRNVIEDSGEHNSYLINFGSGTIVNESSTGDIKMAGAL